MHTEHELLFLMINLSQMNDVARMLYFYQDFMNRLFPSVGFEMIQGKSEKREEFPVSTLNYYWGRIELKNRQALQDKDLSLFRNSVSLLSIILENRMMYDKLYNEANAAKKKYEVAENITDRFFDLSPELLCIASIEGYFVKLNQSWTKLLGWSNEELMATKWHDFIHPEDLMKTEKSEALLKEGKRIDSFENRYRSKKGEYIWLSWNSLHFPKEGYIFAIARDITRERAEQKTKVQNEKMMALGQLAGGVAHDFNNQLTGIMGFAELALSEIDPSSPIRNYIENIIQSVTRSKDLTYQLLAYARKGTDNLDKIDLNKLIHEVCIVLERTTSHSIEIIEERENAQAYISGDPSQIQNMLLNLGLNAQDAMPKGGVLRFSTSLATSEDLNQLHIYPESRKVDRFICLQVKDTGEGIDPSIVDKIYDPFFTTKPLQKGTGIGLSAVYGTIKRHKGYIGVDSTIGKGTCFSIFFPILYDGTPTWEAEKTDFIP